MACFLRPWPEFKAHYPKIWIITAAGRRRHASVPCWTPGDDSIGFRRTEAGKCAVPSQYRSGSSPSSKWRPWMTVGVILT